MSGTAKDVERIVLRSAWCLVAVALLGIAQGHHSSRAQAESAEISSYENSVLADEPTAYYRLDEAGGTSMLDASGHSRTGAFVNVVHGAPGAVGDGDTATTFDGISASASAALDLSGTRVITTEFWLNWSGTPGDDRLAAEFSDSSNPFFATNGSFYLSPDSAWDQGFEVSMGDGSGVRFSGGKFARPNAGAWHYYAIVIDRAAGTIIPYVDGVLQPFTYTVSGTSATNFGKLTLWLMSHLGTAQFGQGTLDDFAIYPRALSATQVTTHFAASGHVATTETPSTNAVTVISTVDATTQSVLPTSLGTSAFLPNSMSGEYGWSERRSSVGNPIVDVAQRFTWSDVEPNGPGENESWSTLHKWIDTHLAVAQARGGRLLTGGPAYMNPPEPGGIPAWVYDNPASNSIQVSGYGTTFWVPDCNSEFYLHRMELLFVEIGRYVANKPAWGFFSNHTVGSFGEWHFFPFSDLPPITFPANGPNGSNGYATDASIKRLNDAMINNLHHPERGQFAAVMAESSGTPPTMASRGFRQAMSNIYPNTVATQNDAFGSLELAGATDMIIQVGRWRTAPLLVEGLGNPSDIGNSDTDPNLMNTWEQMTRMLHVSMVSGGLIKQAYVNNVTSIYQKMINEAGYRYQIDSVTLPTMITRGAGFTVSSIWENLNLAPTYDPWVIAWQLRRQSDGVQVWEGLSTYNLTAITDSTMGAVTVASPGLTVPSSVPAGTYDVHVMVRTTSTLPYLSPMHLNISGRLSDGSYSIGSVQVTAE